MLKMTIEIAITETVNVGDLLGPVIKLFRQLMSWLKPIDESADTPDVEDEEDNKSPPSSTTVPADSGDDVSPPDLGIYVSDESKTQDSFGP